MERLESRVSKVESFEPFRAQLIREHYDDHTRIEKLETNFAAAKGWVRGLAIGVGLNLLATVVEIIRGGRPL